MEDLYLKTLSTSSNGEILFVKMPSFPVYFNLYDHFDTSPQLFFLNIMQIQRFCSWMNQFNLNIFVLFFKKKFLIYLVKEMFQFSYWSIYFEYFIAQTSVCVSVQSPELSVTEIILSDQPSGIFGINIQRTKEINFIVNWKTLKWSVESIDYVTLKLRIERLTHLQPALQVFAAVTWEQRGPSFQFSLMAVKENQTQGCLSATSHFFLQGCWKWGCGGCCRTRMSGDMNFLWINEKLNEIWHKKSYFSFQNCTKQSL